MDKYSLELLNKFTPLGVKDLLSLNWKKTSQSTRMGSVRPLCFCPKVQVPAPWTSRGASLGSGDAHQHPEMDSCGRRWREDGERLVLLGQ